jgi:Fe-S cluster assembly protein SufD
MTVRTVTRRKVEAEKVGEAGFPFTQADVKRISKTLREPAWLAKRRLRAWEQYGSLPMPSLKDEAWRRTDIRALPADQLSLGAAADVPADQDLLQPLASQVHGSLLVLRPGYPSTAELSPQLADQGVIFADWATAVREHSRILEAHMGTVVPDNESKFSALAAAMAADGVLLYVPKGIQMEQPLHSVVWMPGDKTSFFSRVLIILEAGASVTYVHETASPTMPDSTASHAGIVEMSVGDGARLTFIELQNLGQHVWNFTHERAHVGRAARLDWVFGGVGSRLTKNYSQIDLLGEGAEGRMSGFYFADGVQHLDHDTQQNHMAAHTTSDLLFKGALLERSRSVWQGMIYVAPGAQKTDGYQANRNLLLSKKARADSIPGLEILADDVRCSHGATVGQLEQEPIFYLMSRGLTHSQAVQLLVDGFFAPIMERVPFEGVRERLKRMIDDKMKLI